MSYIISHDSRAKNSWNLIVIFCSILFAIVQSYRLTFSDDHPDIIYWTCIGIFALDIVLNFNFAVRIGLKLFNDYPSIARNYLKGWFFIDLLAAIPFSGILYPLTSEAVIDKNLLLFTIAIRILPLFKIIKVLRLLKEVQENLGISPGIMRLTNFAYLFIHTVHFMSLGWIIIGAAEVNRTPVDQYIRSLYWCITTIATIGYGDYFPNHEVNIQILYTIVVQIFGVGMYGYIIGNISTLVANLDIARANYQKKMEEIDDYMRSKDMPKTLQGRVKDYYYYLWETRKSVSSISFLSELPHTLHMNILLHLNKEVLEKVELFKNADEIFIREIVHLLKPLVYLPDDFIIMQGEYGDCMYFLNAGTVDVLVGGKKVVTLGAGSPFGETALIQGEKRTASIQAVAHCEVYRLDKDDFDNLRKKYPEFDEQIKKIVEERLTKK